MQSKSGGRTSRPVALKGLVVDQQQRMTAAAMLAKVPDDFAKLFIFDPQYRTVLEHLDFGNEGSRQKGRAKLPQMSDDHISFLVEEAERVLKPSGHLLLWVDKFSIASGTHLRYLRRADDLKLVDLIAWNKLAIGMGRRTRCLTEYLVIAQKLPTRAKGVWSDHSIRDCWTEQADKSAHPHAKPIVLIERLIRAVTNRGDVVIDPCAGGYGVLEACRLSGRRFLGCDILG